MSISLRDEELNLNKEIRDSFKDIIGIGKRKAMVVCAKIGLCYPYFVDDIGLYKFQLAHILLKGLCVSKTKISRRVEITIKNLQMVESYRGIHHQLCLPTRGQRTKRNAKTCKKKRNKGK